MVIGIILYFANSDPNTGNLLFWISLILGLVFGAWSSISTNRAELRQITEKRKKIEAYKAGFNAEVKKKQQEFLRSNFAAEIGSRLSGEFAKKIGLAARPNYQKTISITFQFTVRLSGVSANETAYWFEGERYRYRNLSGAAELMALAQVLTVMVRNNVLQVHVKDVSGTNPTLDAKIDYADEPRACVTITYKASNGFFRPAREWN